MPATIHSPAPPNLSRDEHVARLTSPARLAALRATGLLNGESDEVLNRVARLGAALLGVPISLISLVDDHGQHFAGMQGLGGWAGDNRGTPLSHSFCQWVVTTDKPLVINDARRETLTMDHPAHTDLGVVAYAGVPLRTAEGETLGAMCGIDVVPVQWSDSQIAALEDLAAAAMAEIELRVTVQALAQAHERLREQVIRDPLTGLLNRRGFAEHARRHLALAEREGHAFVIAALDMDGLKQINDTLGHDAGDQALLEFATTLARVCRTSDLVARVGGDEFLCLLAHTTGTEAAGVFSRLRCELRTMNEVAGSEYQLATSVGSSEWSTDQRATIQTLMRQADEMMYEDKRTRKAPARHVA